MNAYYGAPNTFHGPSPESNIMHFASSGFASSMHSPGLAMPYDATNQYLHVSRAAHPQYAHYEYDNVPPAPSHSEIPSHLPGSVLGPDAEFAHHLRGLQGSGSSSTGRASDGEEPTQSRAIVAETIVRARKSWKTVKGRSEPVWPPNLEKALIQGLLSYKPNDAQYTRALGRFPRRNRFISDYIFNMTGVRRSPKQVGSRLQQLKDVACGRMLLNHVASWSQSPSSAPASASGSPSPLDMPLDQHPELELLLNDVQSLASGSEGSQSPISPLATAPGHGLPFASSSSSESEYAPFIGAARSAGAEVGLGSGMLDHSYPAYAHMQMMGYPPEVWFAHEQSSSGNGMHMLPPQ